METKLAPKALSTEVHQLGVGLPLAISERGYRELLAATRVKVKGRLSGATGPVALTAGVSAARLSLAAQLAPIPNLETFSDHAGSAFLIRVASVKDTQGGELLDLADPSMTERGIDRPQLERERSLLAPDEASQDLQIDALHIPGTPMASLHALSTFPLQRPVEISQVARIEGTVELLLPVGAKSFVQRGATWSLNHDTVSISSASRDGGQGVDITVTKGADRLVACVAKDAAGNVLDSSATSRLFGDDGKVNLGESYGVNVATVTVVLASSVLRMSYPFVLTQ